MVRVTAAVTSAMGAAGTVTDELVPAVHDVAARAMQASEQVGTGLVTRANSIAKGVVLRVDVRVDAVGGDIAKAAAETVTTDVKHATAVGADVSSIARRAVDGVIEVAVETGPDVGRIADAAIKSATQSAGQVGSVRSPPVGGALAGVVRGVDDLVGKNHGQALVLAQGKGRVGQEGWRGRSQRRKGACLDLVEGGRETGCKKGGEETACS